jgi:hypothetical protein
MSAALDKERRRLAEAFALNRVRRPDRTAPLPAAAKLD